MDRVAVFVDAGYLFAQGSVAIAGSKRSRPDLVLDAPAVVQEFKRVAETRAANCSLLRIYWYDGTATGSRPTAEQALMAHQDDVKLRLGFLNSVGQQKGVDSLIVTDLIELARQKAICDAVLISGDEDVRVGVQIAQNYGVRVHLLGIEPSRANQSQQLLQEADTTTEWPAETVRRFLALRPQQEHEAVSEPAVDRAREQSAGQLCEDHRLEAEVRLLVEALEATELEAIRVYWRTDRGVPSEFDRKLLPRCRDAIGRDLAIDEKRQIRAAFQTLVRVRLKSH
ncbi:NYN domain-containing protein [Microvirga arabica]|uniref:NYN domain-containing protein n=1 Tax=Microvirga arabica TaxID=1128671 RepID=UPI00193AB005|nr:NYN domain-containing protein [Microvirga arabica]MBM1170355.1 NYN domain-containing protein [Microvirga arabica]